MSAKKYIQQTLEKLEKKHTDKPEFLQAFSEFFPMKTTSLNSSFL